MANDGKYFEKKATGVISQLNPTNQVIPNVRITGKLSDSSRQLDIIMRDPGEYDFIAFECKDEKTATGTPTVEAYNTKLQDVGAKHGAIVSNSKFTSGAKNMAKKLDIDLLNLIDTEDDAIKTQLLAPSILVKQRVKQWKIQFSEPPPSALNIKRDTNYGNLVIRQPAKKNASVKEIADQFWNEIANTRNEERGIFTREIDDATIIVNGNMVSLPQLQFIFDIDYEYRAGALNIIQSEGLYNVQDGSYQFQHVGYGPFSDAIFKSWRSISKNEKDSLHSSIILFTRTNLVLSNQS